MLNKIKSVFNKTLTKKNSLKKSQFHIHPIYDSLKKLLAQEEPEYAYMIDGKWGSGKTFFLQEQLQSICQESSSETLSKINIRYISANGITSMDELLMALLISRLESVNKTTGKYIPGVTKLILKYLDNKTGWDLSSIEIPGLASYNSNTVIIIDDLERVDADCDLIGLLGKINSHLIEHKNIKTILVCDESQIKKRFPSEEYNNSRKFKGSLQDYKNAKEKIISYTLKFYPELEEVIPKLISNSPLKDVFNFGNIEELIEICQKNNLENIRTIKFFLEVLGQIYFAIGKTKFKLVLSYLIGSFVPQVIAFREGDFSLNKDGDPIENLLKSVEGVNNYIFAEREYLKSISHLIIFNELLEDQMNIEIDSLISSRKLNVPSSLTFQKFYFADNYLKMEDSEFDDLLKIVIRDCKAGKFNLTQLSILLVRLDHYYLTYGSFNVFTSRKEIIDLVQPALKKLKPENEVEYISLESVEQRLNDITHKDYEKLKSTMINLEEKLAQTNEQNYAYKILENVIKTKKFDKNRRELYNIMIFIPFKDTMQLTELYISSNSFKKEFNNEVRLMMKRTHYEQIIKYYEQFLNIVKKDSDALSIPGRAYIKILEKLIDDYKIKNKPYDYKNEIIEPIVVGSTES